MTVDELRKVVTQLIADGRLANPQQMRLQGPHVVMDIDDHISDEAIGGGRIRVVLRSPAELMMIARALEGEGAPRAGGEGPASTHQGGGSPSRGGR